MGGPVGFVSCGSVVGIANTVLVKNQQKEHSLEPESNQRHSDFRINHYSQTLLVAVL